MPTINETGIPSVRLARAGGPHAPTAGLSASRRFSEAGRIWSVAGCEDLTMNEAAQWIAIGLVFLAVLTDALRRA